MHVSRCFIGKFHVLCDSNRKSFSVKLQKLHCTIIFSCDSLAFWQLKLHFYYYDRVVLWCNCNIYINPNRFIFVCRQSKSIEREWTVIKNVFTKKSSHPNQCPLHCYEWTNKKNVKLMWRYGRKTWFKQQPHKKNWTKWRVCGGEVTAQPHCM